MRTKTNKTLASVLSSIVLLLSAATTYANTVVSALAQELYQASGLQAQIAMIPAQTERSFDLLALSQSMPLEFDRLDQQAMRAAVPLSFSEARLQTEMLNALDTVTEPHLQSMVSWFNSDLGKKVRKAELENSLLANQARYADFKFMLQDNPASDTRIALAKHIDKALRVSESAADTLINLQIGFTLSIMSAAGTPIKVEEYAASVQANRTNIIESYRVDSVETILFIYQDLSNKELSQFLDSMRLQAARKYIHASNQGIANGMLAASSSLGSRIGAMFEPVPKKPGI